MIDWLISDWNEVLFRDKGDSGLLKAIGMGALWHSIVFQPIEETIRLGGTKWALEALIEEFYRADEARDEARKKDAMSELERIYNNDVINGLPMKVIDKSVERYARRKETQKKLEKKLLDAIANSGLKFGILSYAYRDGITSILRAAKYDKLPQFIRANGLEEMNGNAIAFKRDIDIFKKNKPEYLKLAAGDYGLKLIAKDDGFLLPETAYLGDQEDEICFTVVGYPIVSPSATDEFKQKCKTKYNAFAPKDHEDLKNYLIKCMKS